MQLKVTVLVAALSWPCTVAIAQEVSTVAAVQEAGGGRSLSPRAPSTDDIAAQRALARERFIRGDVRGALDALNVIGEPRISTVAVEGLVRTKRTDVYDYLGLGQGDLLTPGKLARATRRLDDFPTASSGKVRYDLLPDSVVLRPILFERDRSPEVPTDWIPVGVRTVFTQEARLSIANATGHSDVWTPYVRWAQGRPRAGLSVVAPAPAFLPGNIEFDTSWSRQEYLTLYAANGRREYQEPHTHASLGLSDWLTSWMRWHADAALDRISSVSYVGANGSVNTRFAGDRISTSAGGGWFTGANRQESFRVGEVTIAARSSAHKESPMVTGMAGYSVASLSAPLAAWPSASSGTGYTAMLRAHRLYEAGTLTGDVFGRQMVFGSMQYLHPIPTRMGPAAIRAAVFADVAQARHRLAPGDSPLHVDIGAGLRFNTSRNDNEVRLEIARGLRDGLVRVSAGYVQAWGERRIDR